MQAESKVQLEDKMLRIFLKIMKKKNDHTGYKYLYQMYKHIYQFKIYSS